MAEKIDASGQTDTTTGLESEIVDSGFHDASLSLLQSVSIAEVLEQPESQPTTQDGSMVIINDHIPPADESIDEVPQGAAAINPATSVAEERRDDIKIDDEPAQPQQQEQSTLPSPSSTASHAVQDYQQSPNSGQINIEIEEPSAQLQQNGNAEAFFNAIAIVGTPTVETAAKSDHDKAVTIAEKMSAANWPLPVDMEVTIEEIKEPTKLPDGNNCCIPCHISYKNKGKQHKLGYLCDKQKLLALQKGTKTVFKYWTDGLTPRWKLLYMFCQVFLYLGLSGVAAGKFAINASKGEHIVFDAVSFAFSALGCLIAFAHAVVFCIRRRKELLNTILETLIDAVLLVYCCCCCSCKVSCLEKLKEKKEERNSKRGKANKFAAENERFKPPRNCLQKFIAQIGNMSEVLLTIVNDVILTIVFIISLYSFLGNQDFRIFYDSTETTHRLGFCILAFSALKLIFITHGLRVFSIAKNVQALDKKVERDSEDMQVELSNKCIRYSLSFQARLVYHVLVSSTFQLYCIFALSWKIIQDSCTVVPLGNGSNSSNISAPSGAPFTCTIPTFVNGFTIYNILYIALAPTLLGYTSFFLCNIPWLVEYMQTITMWTYLQVEYTTGFRVREDDRQVDGKDGGDIKAHAAGEDNGKAAYISPRTRLLRIFFNDLLCDVSDEDLQRRGADAAHIRDTIQENQDTDTKTFGSNAVSRAFTKLRMATFFIPAIIIGVYQLVFFAAHLVFMGCDHDTHSLSCFSSNIHAVLSSMVLDDYAAVFFPMIILFLMTSYPGPWIGLFWALVVLVIVIIVVIIVAFVVAVVAIFVLLIFLAACAGGKSEEHRVY